MKNSLYVASEGATFVAERGTHRARTVLGRREEDGLFQTQLNKLQQEVERLDKNRIALLDIMSDMIFLIRDDFVIEYMNAVAVEAFGSLRGRVCYRDLAGGDQPCPQCPVRQAAAGDDLGGLIERRFGRVHVEYSAVSFEGYRGERLVMIVMRNITKRKEQEAQLAEYHNNIEEILQKKIDRIKESEQVRRELTKEVNIFGRELERRDGHIDGMVGKSRKLNEIREMISHVADSDATILITGESGTGKELVADIIHRSSRRNGKPFFKFNCAAVGESLLESDLFGYEKGAFTGATSQRPGKFEITNGGTIFLDEIGDISPRMQSSLLRVLQNGEIVRVGGNKAIKVDVRIITATNADLASAVENNQIRRDLYYRLNVINIHLPPLRERKEDIVPLISHFIKKYRVAFNKEIDYLPNRIIERLLEYDWPGNIRELENVIKRAVLLARGNVVMEKDLLGNGISERTGTPANGKKGTLIDERLLKQPFKDSMAELEARLLAAALNKHQGNPVLVARILGMGKTTLYEKLKRYGLAAGGRQR